MLKFAIGLTLGLAITGAIASDSGCAVILRSGGILKNVTLKGPVCVAEGATDLLLESVNVTIEAK